MIQKQSLIKNYVYQFLYQGLILIIPFVLSPYLTRTLMGEGLGVYTYVNSIAYYFVIAANLGIGVHGKRIISQNSGDEIELRKKFWSLFTLHAIISVLVSIIYIGYIALFVTKYETIYIIELAYVLSALFDITWLFYGLENFKSVVIRNTVVKVIECVLIFSFVKSPGDLSTYTFITGGSLLAGQVVMLPMAMKIVKPIRFKRDDVFVHIKPLLLFSVALIASSLYTVFDKTLIGMMMTIDNVAFYEFSNRIISIPRTFVEVASTVMFPRACKLAAAGDIAGQKKYINYSFIITAFIGVGSVFGLAAIADQFALLYYGEEFAICGSIMISLSPLVYIVGAGKILRSQCLIPNGMDKQFNLCIVYNAIINLALSALLIPYCGVYGAVIGTIAAELFGFVYQFVLARNFVNIKIIFVSLVPFIVNGLIMFLVLKFVSAIVPTGGAGLVLQVCIGVVVYCLLSILYLILFKKDFALELKNKFIKKGLKK